MLDGKMLRGVAGTPMRSTALANSVLALAEPDPLTLANLTTKSLTRSRRAAPSAPRPVVAATCVLRVRDIEKEALHVPGAGRAALGAQAAVKADILVLHHHPAGLQLARDVQLLRHVRAPAPSAARAASASSPFAGEGDAIHRADVDAGVAFDAQLVGEHRLHVAVQAALRLGEGQLLVEAELDLGA